MPPAPTRRRTIPLGGGAEVLDQVEFPSTAPCYTNADLIPARSLSHKCVNLRMSVLRQAQDERFQC